MVDVYELSPNGDDRTRKIVVVANINQVWKTRFTGSSVEILSHDSTVAANCRTSLNRGTLPDF